MSTINYDIAEFRLVIHNYAENKMQIDSKLNFFGVALTLRARQPVMGNKLRYLSIATDWLGRPCLFSLPSRLRELA